MKVSPPARECRIEERTLHRADLRAGGGQGLEEVRDEVLIRVCEVCQVRLHRFCYLQQQSLSAVGPAHAAGWQLQCMQGMAQGSDWSLRYFALNQSGGAELSSGHSRLRGGQLQHCWVPNV